MSIRVPVETVKATVKQAFLNLDLAAGKMETKDISTGRVFNNMQDEEKK